MLKKTITYLDFNGNEVTEDAYFNYTTPEFTRLNAKFGRDGANAYLKKLASGELDKMVKFIEDLVLNAYGRKSEDGSRFIKSPEIRKEFEESAAYAELFEQLLLNPSEMQVFIVEAMSASTKEKQAKLDDLKVEMEKNPALTNEQLLSMNEEQIDEYMKQLGAKNNA